MILLIDNYDSFSYNLYQLLGEINPDIKVIRNDEMTVEAVQKLEIEKIVLSPGSGRPQDAGICEEIVRRLGSRIPILGVCLGHQAICEVYGATIGYAASLMHGKQSEVVIDEESRLFRGLPKKIQVARYHSLAVQWEKIPKQLRITAMTKEREIMAVEHREFPIYGLQFHPESILTPEGKQIIQNFVEG